MNTLVKKASEGAAFSKKGQKKEINIKIHENTSLSVFITRLPMYSHVFHFLPMYSYVFICKFMLLQCFFFLDLELLGKGRMYFYANPMYFLCIPNVFLCF